MSTSALSRTGSSAGTGPGATGAPPRRTLRLTANTPLPVLIIKIAALAILDALVVYAIFVLIASNAWVVAAIAAIAMIAVNYVYFSTRALPWKYLAPGVAFLVVFQIFVILYSAYIGFTNYGDGHDGTKDAAIASIEQASLTRVPNSPQYGVSVVQKGDTYGLLVTDPQGKVSLGDSKTPLQPVTGATLTGGVATGVPGWRTLSLAELSANQSAVQDVAVPLTSNLSQGAIRTADGATGYLFQPRLTYSDSAGTFTDTKTGAVYADDGKGEFASKSGTALKPGWTITVGFTNFIAAFANEGIRTPLIGVIAWTFAFAALATFTCFSLGLFLAITFNHPTMRGKRIYRVILILPYAFPGFLSALVWSGLLNEQFGFFNTVLFGGAEIPWLTDPWLAKLSVLIVNLWLGFPYMFLVSTGALQSIPEEALEAATVDGAQPWAVFRLIKLPLLLVTMAPILIATFAYNFNNFNIIYLLTGGGPQDINAPINVGSTDILITLVYKIAFEGSSGRNYGLASAFSILIFIFVAVISIVAFRRTKSLEDIN